MDVLVLPDAGAGEECSGVFCASAMVTFVSVMHTKCFLCASALHGGSDTNDLILFSLGSCKGSLVHPSVFSGGETEAWQK